MTVAQHAHRMPDAPLGVGSMRTAPFSSSSPWLVMYDTGSPSCVERGIHDGNARLLPCRMLRFCLHMCC